MKYALLLFFLCASQVVRAQEFDRQGVPQVDPQPRFSGAGGNIRVGRVAGAHGEDEKAQSDAVLSSRGRGGKNASDRNQENHLSPYHTVLGSSMARFLFNISGPGTPVINLGHHGARILYVRDDQLKVACRVHYLKAFNRRARIRRFFM